MSCCLNCCLFQVGRSSSPSADSLRKEIDALTSDYQHQQESLHADVLHGMAAAAAAAVKDSNVDRLMVPPGLVAATSVGSWR